MGQGRPVRNDHWYCYFRFLEVSWHDYHQGRCCSTSYHLHGYIKEIQVSNAGFTMVGMTDNARWYVVPMAPSSTSIN
jgi:hypothetical protein